MELFFSILEMIATWDSVITVIIVMLAILVVTVCLVAYSIFKPTWRK